VNPLPGIQAEHEKLDADASAAMGYRRESPSGIAMGDLTETQRHAFRDLIDGYIGRLPDSIAIHEQSRIEGAGLDAVSFAWAGSDRPGRPHYYRIHGPTMLVEYACIQDMANHTHAVWRDPDRYFGAHLLADHLRTDHLRNNH